MVSHMATDPTPDQEVVLARQAFAHGDLGHALHHVGCALSSNPTRQDWIGLLDGILRRADNPLALTEPAEDEEMSFVTGASRAYTYAIRGEWNDAFSILTQVVGARPDIPYLAWAEGWLGHFGRGLEWDDLLPNLVVPLVKKLPQLAGPDDPCTANLRHAANICALLRQWHPHQGFVWYASSSIARKMGAHAESIPFAQQGLAVEPSFLTSIALACALRDAGQIDAAIAAYHDARRHDSEDITTFLDIGDMLIGASRFAEAAQIYGQVLAKDPQHPWALASAYYARFKAGGNPADRAALLALRDRFPDESRVTDLCDEIDPPVPYFNVLPHPGDATAKALSDILRMVTEDPSKAQGGNVALTVTHPESPSVLLAFRLATAHLQPALGVKVTVEEVQMPDPRIPKGQVDIVPWIYEGNEPRPNLAPPDPRLAEAVGHIAAQPYNLDAWEPNARALATQLQPGWIPNLVATMVHPPAVPPGMDAFAWVQRVQIAAAMVIGFIDQGWEGSARKRALQSLAIGPVDWTASAAIVVMARLAKQDPQIRREVEPLFKWLEAQIPKGSFTCFEYPLASCWLGMGGHDAQTQQHLEAWRDAIERGEGSDHEGTQEGGADYEGLDLERYAEFCVKRDAIVAKHAQAHGFGAGAAFAAMQGDAAWPELEKLCAEYGVTPKTYIEGVGHVRGADVARVHAWDQQINGDPAVQKAFFAAKSRAQLAMSGIDPNSEEGRVAQRIQSGAPVDLSAEKVRAAAAAQQMQQGQGGDPDPVVFPGQKVAKLSDYVGMMKIMQTGNMMGALQKYGLDMGSYGLVAQAWGVKLAADPVLTAKFSKMMGG
jgi:tetratricopeptide (TPR) repeat protein